MGEYRKYKKNPFAKAFKKELGFVSTIPKSTLNKPTATVNEEELRILENVGIDIFNKNKQLYKHSKIIRNLKFFANYAVPFTLVAIGTKFALNTSKAEMVVPKYRLEQTVICDEKMAKFDDGTEYIVTQYEPKVEQANLELTDNIDGVIQYQVKNGIHNVIVTINIGEDGELVLDTGISGDFYDYNSSLFDGVDSVEMEAKYQEVIDGVAEFIEASNLNSTYKKDIKEMLEKEKTLIITTIIEYIQSGEVEVIEPDASYDSRRILREFFVVLIGIVLELVLAVCGCAKTRELDSYDDGELYFTNSKVSNFPFLTTAKEKTKFVEAEKKRRATVKRLAKEYLTPESQKYFDI